jgi:adenylate cyclase class 2
MAHETEIKLHVHDLKALRQRLKRLGAGFVSGGSGRVHEWNELFDTLRQELGKNGQLLRIRKETAGKFLSNRRGRKEERVLLTFKRPVGAKPGRVRSRPRRERHKVREEIELQVANRDAMAEILEGLGLRGWFRYEKFRTTYRLPLSQTWAKGLLIELDETPIGTFIELEGPPKAIDRAAKELGFKKRDYVVTNYLSLYREECRRRGEKPCDMVFGKRTCASEW